MTLVFLRKVILSHVPDVADGILQPSIRCVFSVVEKPANASSLCAGHAELQNHGAALTQKAQIPTLLLGLFVCLLGKEGQFFGQGVSGTWLFLEEQYTSETQLLSP